MEERTAKDAPPDPCTELLRELLDPACLAGLALAPQERVLDVGCGAGVLTRAMAARALRVVGVDCDPDALDLARLRAPAVDFRLGSATELPLLDGEWGSFDVVHARFLFESLREQEGAARQMVRAARPGGRIVLADDDHQALRLWPPCPGLDELWAAYLRAFDAAGNDAIAGRRLVERLAEAGAISLRNRSISFDVCAGDHQLSLAVDRLGAIFTGSRPAILAGGFDAAAFDATIAALDGWRRRPDAAVWYVLRWAEGRRPDR
jgi:ubiquinone/menaquinone biosynthesis C-methylase UbiE